MKLTEKKALELTLKLWRWLESNPHNMKRDWPEWKENGGKYNEEKVNSACFLCWYVKQRTSDSFFETLNCREYCPLLATWKRRGSFEECYNPCMAETSPYYKWEKSGESKYAKIIADACEKKLTKMEKIT